jgi:hypothetical protein
MLRRRQLKAAKAAKVDDDGDCFGGLLVFVFMEA